MGTDALQGLVWQRLCDAHASERLVDLVLAAAASEEVLRAAIGGAPVERPTTASSVEPSASPGLFLGSVAVTGFRGISVISELRLQPRPGLTLVVGRNGSGKSSFAEAVELGLVGTCSRWAERNTVDWKNGWRNLHHQGERHVEIVLRDGGGGDTKVGRRWSPEVTDVDLGDLEVSGRHDLGSLGLAHALTEYPPMLSYNDLGEMLHKRPSELHDAIGRGLGTDDLDVVRERLRDARLDLKKRVDAHKHATKALIDDLRVIDDPRAARACAALDRKSPDLVAARSVLVDDHDDGGDVGALEALVALTLPAEIELAEFAAVVTDALDERERATIASAARADQLADLLTAALAFHDAHPDATACPVCGTAAVIDDSWSARTTATVEEQRNQSVALRAANRKVDDLDRASLDLIGGRPQALATDVVDVATLRDAWDDWASLRDEPDLATRVKLLEIRRRAVAAALEVVQSASRAELDRRSVAWLPFIGRIANWADDAEQLSSAAATLKEITEAESWMKDTIETVRADRLSPVLRRVGEVWGALRRDSNVSLGRIELTGTGPARKARIVVNVDDEESVALSVMSQGELHAFALSLFLPRATMDASPFRFVIIDDPVQAMDAARVDGLARVLHEVAADRQVVVFTHDERLPRACRRLDLDARVIEVTRDLQSIVTTRTRSDPGGDLADDARKFLRDPNLSAEIKARVVPGVCRQAIEAAATDVVWRRGIDRAKPFEQIEAQLADTLKLKQLLALALFGDIARAGDVLAELNRSPGSWAANAVQQSEQGMHGEFAGLDLAALTDATARLVGHLGQRRVAR